MIFSKELFDDATESQQHEIVDYFQKRQKPKPLAIDFLANCPEWRIGDSSNAITNADNLLQYRFKEDNGQYTTFNWQNPTSWHNLDGRLLFSIKRGMLLGDICIAWLQSSKEKYLDLFADFYSMFDNVAELSRSPLDLSDGDSAFFGGPDPNMPWLEESWGKFHNPMCTGFRLSRFWRIWNSGIFSYLPTELAFRFIKSIFTDLMTYKTIIEAPFKVGNHYLFEVGVAPYIASFMFPEFPECKAIKKLAAETINNSISKTILPDGSFYEHTSGYDVITFNDILYPYALALQNGETLLTKTNTGRLKKSANFIRDLFHPDGAMTQFGDSCPRNITDAVSVSRKDFKEMGLDFKPSQLPIHYPKGGYAFLGNSNCRLAISAVNQHHNKAHIHWEHLTFEFCHDGIVWIGDPASVLRARDPYTRPLIYSGKARKAVARQYHYSLAAHNCVLIDSLIPGDEPYSDHEFGGCPPKCTNHKFTENPQTYSATHHLFESLGIKHNRTFKVISSTKFQIDDSFTGHPDKRQHCYKTIIHPMPDVNITIKGQTAILNKDGKSITLNFSHGTLSAEPSIHIQSFAYTDEEKKLCHLVNTTYTNGQHQSSFTIEL